jgi:hypothetical protein
MACEARRSSVVGGLTRACCVQVRAIFAAHPPRELAPGEAPVLPMTIFTDGDNSK